MFFLTVLLLLLLLLLTRYIFAELQKSLFTFTFVFLGFFSLLNWILLLILRQFIRRFLHLFVIIFDLYHFSSLFWFIYYYYTMRSYICTGHDMCHPPREREELEKKEVWPSAIQIRSDIVRVHSVTNSLFKWQYVKVSQHTHAHAYKCVFQSTRHCATVLYTTHS